MSRESIIRAVTFAVAEPLSGDWKQLNADLSSMWKLTTQISNWMMTQCYVRDVRRGGQAKMPKMPALYLYPEVRKLWPDFPPQSAASLERAVQRKYRKLRYQIVWTAGVSLPSHRYPVPFPIHNQSWDLWFDSGNRPVVNPRIADKRWELRLAGGSRYRHQLATFRKMLDGTAKRGEMAIYKDHQGKILVKMVATLPAATAQELAGTLIVRTEKDKLLVADDIKDDRIWNLNFDHILRWVREYNTTLQRLREDRKAEHRNSPSFSARQAAIVSKQHRRMDSAVKEIAAQLIGFAVRRKFAKIHYTDKERITPDFPWFILAAKLEDKAKEYGIEFEHASGEVRPEMAEALARGLSQ